MRTGYQELIAQPGRLIAFIGFVLSVSAAVAVLFFLFHQVVLDPLFAIDPTAPSKGAQDGVAPLLDWMSTPVGGAATAIAMVLAGGWPIFAMWKMNKAVPRFLAWLMLCNGVMLWTLLIIITANLVLVWFEKLKAILD